MGKAKKTRSAKAPFLYRPASRPVQKLFGRDLPPVEKTGLASSETPAGLVTEPEDPNVGSGGTLGFK